MTQMPVFPGFEQPQERRRSGDPRLSPLKSAIQKYVRRGEITKAVSTAAEMLEVPGGQASLERRLLVICAEDVGWEWVPALAAAISRGMKPEQVLDAVASLASLPKQKEAYWLANTVWGGRHRIPMLTVDDLLAEIGARDYQAALAILIEGDERDKLRGVGGITAALYQVAERSTPATEALIRSVLKQFRGTAGELWSAAVIAAIDQPESLPSALPRVSWTALPRPKPLDWYTQDGHTRIGGIGLSMVVKRNPMIGRDSLTEMMFDFESIKLAPEEIPGRWRDESFEHDCREHGWQSEEWARTSWEQHYGPLVQDAIEWLQGRWLQEGRYV